MPASSLRAPVMLVGRPEKRRGHHAAVADVVVVIQEVLRGRSLGLSLFGCHLSGRRRPHAGKPHDDMTAPTELRRLVDLVDEAVGAVEPEMR
jgi:hypothetical protein